MTLRAAALAAICVAGAAVCSREPAATPFESRADLIRFDKVDVRLVDALGFTEAVVHVPPELGGPTSASPGAT